MRSIWKGAISFGLVTIPVKLYSATEQKDVSFHQVRRSDGSRLVRALTRAAARSVDSRKPPSHSGKRYGAK